MSEAAIHLGGKQPHLESGEAPTPRGPRRATPPPADAIHDAVLTLRAPGALAARIREAWSPLKCAGLCAEARVLRTYYKPFARARLIAEIVGSDDSAPPRRIRQYLFIQIYADAARARERLSSTDAKHALKCDGPPVTLIDELNAVAWVLPNGPRLRTAKIGFRPKKFRKILRKIARKYGDPVESVPRRPTPPELIRYVPRRRAVFRYQAPAGARHGSMYIKVFAPEDYATARLNHKLLRRAERAGDIGFHPPRVPASSARRRCIVLEEIPGIPFTETVPACRAAEFAAVGTALATLHRSAIEPTSTWTPDAELVALDAAVTDVKRALPSLAPGIDEVVERLVRLREVVTFDRDVPIHGNLFGDQILIEGDRVGIVDWDDLCYGDPLFDVGRLLAHLFLVFRRTTADPETRTGAVLALINAYQDRIGCELCRQRLRWHTATALLMRAKISGLRPLPEHWIDDVAASVSEADSLLRDADDGPSAVRGG